MDYEKPKQKYLDKLKRIASEEIQNNLGVLDIQYDYKTRFNESNRKYVEPTFEPNDLLAKVERYMKANPTSRITKGGLTIGKDLRRRDLRSDIQNNNNLYTIHTNRGVRNLHEIHLIKPKRRLVNYEPDSKIKFGPPNATSTIKYQHTLSPINDKPKYTAGESNKCGAGESSRSSSSSLLDISTIKIFNKNTQAFLSKQSDQEIKKHECTSEDDKVKLDLTSLYVQFVTTQRNEIKSISKKVYPNNDYCTLLKKKLQKIKLKHQNKQDVTNPNLISSPDLVNNDSFNNMSSESIFSCNNFIFKPVIKLFNISDECMSQSFDGSFVCSTQESLITNTSVDSVEIELNDECYSSPEMYSNESNNNHHNQWKPTHSTNSNSYLKKSIQKLNIEEEEEENSEDSFKYYRKKMF